MTLDVKPLTACIGAEIGNIDLADVSAVQLEELHKIWLDWKVLFFRDQHITQEQHIAFGAQFGDLEVHPFAPGSDTHAEIVTIRSDAKNKYAASLWHSDVTWRKEPSLGSILRGVEIPDAGGDTCFSDAAAAYDRLPEATRERFDKAWATHDYVSAFARDKTDEEIAELRLQYPVVQHPVFRSHPDTGARSIYTNRAFVTAIDGVPATETRAVLLELEAAIANPSVQCRFRWQVDSFAMWDNRAVQHFACNDFFPATRMVERVTIVGDRPHP